MLLHQVDPSASHHAPHHTGAGRPHPILVDSGRARTEQNQLVSPPTLGWWAAGGENSRKLGNQYLSSMYCSAELRGIIIFKTFSKYPNFLQISLKCWPRGTPRVSVQARGIITKNAKFRKSENPYFARARPGAGPRSGPRLAKALTWPGPRPGPDLPGAGLPRARSGSQARPGPAAQAGPCQENPENVFFVSAFLILPDVFSAGLYFPKFPEISVFY